MQPQALPYVVNIKQYIYLFDVSKIRSLTQEQPEEAQMPLVLKLELSLAESVPVCLRLCKEIVFVAIGIEDQGTRTNIKLLAKKQSNLQYRNQSMEINKQKNNMQ